MALRPYQDQVLQDLARCLRECGESDWDAFAASSSAFAAGEGPHPVSAVVQIATGGGKTHMAVEAARRTLELGSSKTVAFVADLQEISLDTVRRFEAAGLEVGMVWAGAPREKVRPRARVQVCQLQTLQRRLAQGEAPPDASLAIWDEAHGIESEEAQRLVRRWKPDALVGLTATPSRGDGRGLARTFRTLVQGPQTAELQRDGYLVPLDVIAPSSGYLERGLAMEPVDAYRRYTAWEQHAAGGPGCLERDAEGNFLTGARASRALVFCADGMAKKTASAFLAAGVPAEVLAADTRPRVRQSQRARVAAGETLVICTVDCATKGYDLPALDTVILARGVQVPGLFLQMVGRALRPDPSSSKTRARLIDLRGVTYLHGHPTEDRVWSLQGEAVELRDKAAAYSRCQACLWMGPAVSRGAPCPRCGAALGVPVKPPRVLRHEKMERLEAMPLERRRQREFWTRYNTATRRIGISADWGRCRQDACKVPGKRGTKMRPVRMPRSEGGKPALRALCPNCGVEVPSAATEWAESELVKWARLQGLPAAGGAA